MQIKGAIKVLAMSMVVITVFYLSFTWKTASVRQDAKEYATVNDTLNPEKEFSYLDSISGEVVYNIGFKKYTFRECQERELNLGLDLKGGMNVILEVSVSDIVKSLANNNKDSTFVKAIALAKEKKKNSGKDFLTLFGESFEEIDPNASLAAIFNTIELKDKIEFNSTNKEVLKVIKKESQAAIDNSFNILRSRIDRFGVVQPNIQKLETAGRILIELPGVEDQERVRSLLQGTANLEFWETYTNGEIYPYLLKANEKIKDIEDAKKELADSTKEEIAIVTEGKQPEKEKGKDATLIEQLESDSIAAKDSSAMGASQIAENYPLFAVLQPSVNPRTNELLDGSVIGMAKYTDTSKVNKYLKMEQIRAIFPRNVSFKWHVKSYKYDESESYYELHAIKETGRNGNPPLDGDVITDARGEFGQSKASSEVTMSMNVDGAKTWARLTKNNIGGFIAIVLDDYVYSAPKVNVEIKGGRSSITGDFSINEAKDLANILKSGKLPAPARIIQEAIVGPSLGHEAINSGFNSFLIAFLIVLLYMVFYYSRSAGLVADIALIVNMFFIMGVLASLGAVLTLPGIAGIVLTIGMSVDANVLIYERIREELAAGKGIKLAVKDGYKHAYSAILDANVTTFLTAAVLFIFGTGPIKGFATTLLIGIATSLFTAIFLTRLVFEWYLKHNREISFDTKLTRNAFKGTAVKFIEKRKIFYVISSIVILVGIFSLFTRGLNQGVDFSGGRNYIVRFENPVVTGDISKRLGGEFGETPSVKTFGGDNQVKITTKYRIEENAKDVDSDIENKLYNGLKSEYKNQISFDEFKNEHIMSSQKVGPTIADDIKTQAIWAVLFAFIIIFLYIFIRFKNWQYGLGALVALLHDVLIILGIFSISYNYLPFSLEIDQAFIAAILSVVGYSINDTVVVFDRIREFLHLYPKRDRKSITNSALNSTLSRTFSTSLSTFGVLLSMFIFGGEVIRGFIFALMVGVIVGTYSSLFIASPVVFDTVHKKQKIKNKKLKRTKN
ncbi:MAG: protein translocase subunit SecDF [Bacteroidales bacterium]|jgi:SecD/SecF fusion protein|nr:protein translocase subunit SecDF [Bacteroidales bacterium]